MKDFLALPLFYKLKRVEWPTLALFFVVYMVWGGGVFFHDYISLWLLLPCLAYATALHSSLQHEALHGHPFRSVRLNEALAAIPLGLFIPYRCFKQLHLRHHCDETLTDPYDDPESFYLAHKDWQALNPVLRLLLCANNTLCGRLLLGPALSLYAFYGKKFFPMLNANRRNPKLVGAWLRHGIMLLPVIAFLKISAFPLWLYALGVAYPAMSLLLLRTYAEHQAAEEADLRTAIIEASLFFRLLYLNNNLHVVHHRFPAAPWYRLPQLYRTYYVSENGQNTPYYIKGYRMLFSQFFLRTKEPVPHPFRRRFVHETAQK